MQFELCIMNWVLSEPQSHKVCIVSIPLTNGHDVYGIGLEIKSDIYEYVKVQAYCMRKRVNAHDPCFFYITFSQLTPMVSLSITYNQLTEKEKSDLSFQMVL